MKKDKRLIPKGLYCYRHTKKLGYRECPYWSLKKGRGYRKQNNGYCAFLEKGDWDINKEKKWYTITIIKGKKVKSPLESGDDLGLPMSLLFDRVKECGIKDDIKLEDCK